MRSRCTMPSATTIVTALALALMPASASATPLDVASTHAYIRANYAFVRASTAAIDPTQAKLLGFNKRLARACPNVGEGSPQNEQSQVPSHEVVGALWSVSYRSIAAPINTFVRAVKPLRWSNSQITRAAQHYARTLHELSVLPMPDLCGDIRAWRASGYKTLPASTVSFVEHAESLEGHTIPARLLAPYERASDRGIVKRTQHLESRLEQQETVVGFNDWDLLLETLGLHQ
jgi:hypothetical protein